MKNKTFQFGPLQLQWLESLENNPERQMTGSLGRKQPDGSYKACCLGEAGLVSGVCRFNGEGLLISSFNDEDNSNACYQNSLYSGSFMEIGFRGNTGQRLDNDWTKYLYTLNDNGKTWPEIAAIVRAEPEQYFTEPK